MYISGKYICGDYAPTGRGSPLKFKVPKALGAKENKRAINKVRTAQGSRYLKLRRMRRVIMK